MDKWLEFYPEPVPETQGVWHCQLVTAYDSGSVETTWLHCDFNFWDLEKSLREKFPNLLSDRSILRHFVPYPTDIKFITEGRGR